MSDTPQGLELVVPARANLFATLFLCIWLCGWAFGEMMVIEQLQADGPQLFLGVWLCGWTLGGGLAIYTIAWSLFGRERVVLAPDRISIRNEILGMGRRREYALSQVRNLRVAPPTYDPTPHRHGVRAWGIGKGLIAFDHGSATVRFAAAVEEAEAASIIERFAQRHDFAGARDGSDPSRR